MNKTDIIPVIAQEECAEVIQAISKVFRFGLYQAHPETGVTNKTSLETEIGQLRYMLNALVTEWKLHPDSIACAYKEKAASINKWLEYFPKD